MTGCLYLLFVTGLFLCGYYAAATLPSEFAPLRSIDREAEGRLAFSATDGGSAVQPWVCLDHEGYYRRATCAGCSLPPA